jgi:hypothetical protein
MRGSTNRFFLSFLMLSLVGCLPFLSGCASTNPRQEPGKTILPGVQKVAVIGFHSALSEGARPGWFRDPISNIFIQSEPVPQEAVRSLTRDLFEEIGDRSQYQFVSPDQAGGVYSSLLRSDRTSGMETLLVVGKTGEAFAADAVLVGYVFRWVEREGADFGVSRPASVSFNLYLVRPSDGSVLWKSSFDKTQRALSEDLFDMRTFLKSKGRWLSAENLALVGLKGMLNEMPEPAEPLTGEQGMRRID